MKANSNTSQFKPSTYCDNVSEPLLERINTLENELRALKKQIRALEHEKVFKQQHRDDDAMPLSSFHNQPQDRKRIGPA